MNKILLHIPHASTKIPNVFWEDVFVDKNTIFEFVNAITDVGTDKLFGANKYKKICFKYSRVFCDIEKFADENKEVMSKFGMGVVYTKTNLGLTFRKENKSYKNLVLDKYYNTYHNKLDKLAEKMLQSNKKVVIIDCHSFSKDIIMFEDKKKNLPDICVGFNEEDKLSNLVVEYFTNLGYNVKTNYPYSGSIIPNSLINNPNNNAKSVMIEVNKKIYLNNKTKFKKLQNQINKFLKLVEITNFD